MRAPARYRRGLAARLGLGSLVGASGMMVLREIERRPLRTALSSLGIAGAVALIIFGHFGSDSLNNYLESLFRREQRQDLAVTFERPPGRAPWRAGRAPQLTDQVLDEAASRQLPPRVLNESQARSAGERANR
jgi:putative ABC transport system permease protein